MADRVIARADDGMAYIEVERSAAGQPGILVTMWNGSDGPESAVTVTIPDAVAFLTPIGRWLSQG